MKIQILKSLIKRGAWTTQIILITFTILFVWIFNQFDLYTVLISQSEELRVEVSRFEVFMILVLLLLNVSIAYSLWQKFKKSNGIMKFSTSVIIFTFLVICVWVYRVFNLHDSVVEGDVFLSGNTNRVEVVLLLILILGSIMATLTLFRKYNKVDSIIVMSAYSKKVNYQGDWITIEKFLEKELGVKVSHGITPDEKEEAIRQFMNADASTET